MIVQFFVKIFFCGSQLLNSVFIKYAACFLGEVHEEFVFCNQC